MFRRRKEGSLEWSNIEIANELRIAAGIMERGEWERVMWRLVDIAGCVSGHCEFGAMGTSAKYPTGFGWYVKNEREHSNVRTE